MYVIKINGRRVFFEVRRGHITLVEDEQAEQCDGCGADLFGDAGVWEDRRGKIDGSASIRCTSCGAVFPAARWED